MLPGLSLYRHKLIPSIFFYTLTLFFLQIRWAVESLSTTLYASWRNLQESRRKQGFTSTAATLTVRRVGNASAGRIGGSGEEDGGDKSPGDRRKSRVKEEEQPQRKSSLKVKKQPLRQADPNSRPDEKERGWSKLRGILSSLPDLLENIQELFIRNAAVAEDQKRLDEQEKYSAAGGDMLSSTSKTRTAKKRDSVSSNRSRLSTDRESEGSGPSRVRDKFIDFITQTISLATDCVSVLLNGQKDSRRDESTTSGSDQAGPSSLLPDYVIRLTEEGQITDDVHLTASELYRRTLLSDMQYKVVLNVNGKAVTHSEPMRIRHPSLIADFNQFFELRLIHEPAALSVDIYAVTSGFLTCFMKGQILIQAIIPFYVQPHSLQ